ncbi:thiol:disulfide interchange protein [Agromyces terreus]|uniref:Thiol:disulfide interchange protein n=1 Tax=Agromyces terreus TaxID=424795 RepID=A0A9X2KDA1_9MICO|nr:hypothetical protein [Agromyces terreus]MCP2369357.1 thiol:disulfide interchange protein [Agromyces terreus]
MQTQTRNDTRGGAVAVAAVWALAVIGAAIVLVLAFGGTDEWFGSTGPLGVYAALGVVFAASVLGALLAQLMTRRPHGFVERASVSVGGAALVLAVAAVAVAPTAFA